MSNGAATVRQARSANSCADSEQPTPIATVAQSTRGSITLGAVLCMAVLPGTMIVPVRKKLFSGRFNDGTFWADSFMSINMIGTLASAPFTASPADRIGRRRSIMLLRLIEGAFHVLVISTIMAGVGDWGRPGRRG